MKRLATPGARGGFERARGFTLVELVAVMAIIGVLAAVAAPRFFATDVFAASGYAADLRAAMRHAQALSMASGCATRVVVDGAGYRLQRWVGGADCNDRRGSAQTIGRPGGNAYDTLAPHDVGATASDFFFDSFGRPHDADGTAVTAALVIDIGAQRITVLPDTGLIQ